MFSLDLITTGEMADNRIRHARRDCTSLRRTPPVGRGSVRWRRNAGCGRSHTSQLRKGPISSEQIVNRRSHHFRQCGSGYMIADGTRVVRLAENFEAYISGLLSQERVAPMQSRFLFSVSMAMLFVSGFALAQDKSTETKPKEFEAGKPLGAVYEAGQFTPITSNGATPH
jgi:hypothetical protein